jgi:serine protease Do
MTLRGMFLAAGSILLAFTAALGAQAAEMGWLGAALEPARPRADAAEPASAAGVLVTMIVEDSPAEDAGLRGRDVIIGIDGLDVSSPADMINRIKSLAPDSWIGLRVLRRGVERQLDVRLGTRPTDAGSKRFVRGWIGVRAMEIPPKLRAHFGANEEAGVMVTDIAPGSPAEACGLDLGDVIYAVDGEPVPTVAALFELVARSGVGNEIELSVGRERAPIVLEAVVAKARSAEGP